ncbi:putative glucose-induced degradation protein 8-B [Cocos nucifera]|uniref:Putative glucose-induced degradation protein 8-B n=1 Tax=Cocos nucifera TaxID=13894 RepID=A0A8K0IWF3_COCNU|nr:putative glucose-induced degradation protein 8-B [Cocos nucifera]
MDPSPSLPKPLFSLLLLLLFSPLSSSYSDLFESWCKEHGKRYASEEEKLARFRAFEDNRAFIIEHNAAANSSYTLALNAFADLTHHEFRALRLGLSPRLAVPSDNRTAFRGFVGDVPDSIDWRKKGAVTQIKDQGSCGACWAFSATGAIEGINQIVTGSLASLSEQELCDCDQTYNSGCGGGLMDYAFEWVIQNHGIDTEDDYPYQAAEKTCLKNKLNHRVVTIDGYTDIPTNNGELLLQAVATQPVSVGICGSERAFQLYSKGIFTGPCSTSLDHAVLIVGYGSKDGVDYWILKNSWGTNWGMDGYMHMLRNSGNSQGGNGNSTRVKGIERKNSYLGFDSWNDLLKISPFGGVFFLHVKHMAINDGDDCNIVLSYLMHNCFNETAETFLACTGMKQPVDYLVDMDKRKSIFHFALEGNALKAIELTEQLAPNLLEDNKDLHFDLLSLHFVDLICSRKCTEALEFAQTKLAPFGKVHKYVEKLEDFMALLAYEEPEKSPLFHLLSPDHRQDVADCLNQAILAHANLPSYSSMERLIQQATVVRQCLHQELGKASKSSFIKASDVVPLTISLSIPTNARESDPSPITDLQDSIKNTKVELVDSARKVVDVAIESMMEAAAEVVFAISPIPIIAEMGEDLPDGMAETMKMAGPSCPIKGLKLSNRRGLKFLFLMLAQRKFKWRWCHQSVFLLQLQTILNLPLSF